MSDSSQKTFRSPESKERYDKLLADLKLRLKEYDLTNLIVSKSEYPINTDGGFSDIYTARSLKHGGTKVAIKQLRGVRLGEKAIKVVWREIYNWAECSHANIVDFYGWLPQETSDVPGLVSPWMEKGTLHTVLESEEEIDELQVIKGIASGLQYLHSKDIVHADLKSGNILMSDNNVPLLTDFGVAGRVEGSIATSGTTQTRGTTRWMAVELFLNSSASEDGLNTRTKESDVWAFGMTCYEVVSRRVPYWHLHEVAVSLAIMRYEIPTEPIALNNLGQSLWFICKACWDRDPGLRLSMDAACQSLDSCPDFDEVRTKVASSRLNGKLADLNHLNLTDAVLIDEVASFVGGFSNVHVATLQSPQNSMKVAVKRMLRNSDDKSEDVLQEIQISSAINHPNVLPLLGYVLHIGELPSLVTEWFDNGTLAQSIQRGETLDVPILAKAIAKGVAHLHYLGVAHLDLKSSNILLKNREWPVITDFGVSVNTQVTRISAVTNEIFGTIRWLSPERLYPNEDTHESKTYPLEIMKKWDVWSFGMVLYELFALKVPFHHLISDAQVFRAIIQRILPSSPDLSNRSPLERQIWRIASKQCWRFEPDTRPSMDTIVSTLEALEDIDES